MSSALQNNIKIFILRERLLFFTERKGQKEGKKKLRGKVILSDGSNAALWPGEQHLKTQTQREASELISFVSSRGGLCVLSACLPFQTRAEPSNPPTEGVPQQLPCPAGESRHPSQQCTGAHPDKPTGQMGKFPFCAMSWHHLIYCYKDGF